MNSPTEPTPPLPPLCILLLDDEPVVGDAIQMLLKALGLQSARAATSEEALALAQSVKFDLIISDIKHPGEDGLAMLHLWKKICPTIPVVIISGFVDGKWIGQARELGAAAFVGKPCSLASLHAALHSAWSSRKP